MEIKVEILGMIWTVKFLQKQEDEMFQKGECDGYCDYSIRTICLMENPGDTELSDYEYYLKQNIRHELIHAFLHESGLGCNWEHSHQWGHDETTVDWFARQIPKIEEAWKSVVLKRAELI